MDTSTHTLPCLFSQLGLDNNDMAIESFINKNRGIPPEVDFSKADIWSPSQASFLSEAIINDSDWAEIVDIFSNLLR